MNEWYLIPLMGGLYAVVWVGIICLIIKSVNNVWEKRYYVDDFGKKTNSGYISLKKRYSGWFNNSLGERRIMNYIVTIEQTGVAFKIWEYERYVVNNDTSSVVTMDIKCLGNTTGDILYSSLNLYANSGKLWLVENHNEFIDLLKNNKSVQIIITYGVKKYELKLKQGNLIKILDNIK